MGSKRVKVSDIVRLVERRIHYGDYSIAKMPTEAELAAEVGACRVTARRAVTKLVERGMLVRPPNGRIQLNREVEAGGRRMLIGILSPAWITVETARYRLAIDSLAERFGAAVRSLEYRHWGDALFAEAMSSFDGLFIHPEAERVPQSLVDMILASGKPIVMLHRDVSAFGIPSIDLTPPASFQAMFDHLESLGHRQIDCLNTQPVDESIARRIEQWNIWRSVRGMPGVLLNEPVRSYEDHSKAAYNLTKSLVAAGTFNSRCLFCTTTLSAEAVQRALYESNIKVGIDIALTGANDSEGRAWMCCPSLTVLQSPDPAPYLAVCLEWMQRGGRDWAGPLLMTPSQVPLFVGESTGGKLSKQS